MYLFALYGHYLIGKDDTPMTRLIQFCTVIIHHLVVDEITRRHGPEDKKMTTVRVNDGVWRPHIVALHRFYAFYQFTALASIIVPTERHADLAYNTLIAIQSSAFLMTLFRKGLIRDYTHGFWYTLALIISFA